MKPFPPASDLETRLAPDDHQALKLWLRLLSCTVLVENEIRARLRAEFDITLPRFDLMAQLERHPEGLRMGELSRRMMVTSANVTAITDQLEQEKLVQRVADAGDRRACSVRLTASGRRAFRRMAKVHEGWVADLFAGLDSAQKAQLHDLLALVKQPFKETES